MARMDRYLLCQFLGVFGVFFCSFLGLFVVADSVNNVTEISQYAKTHGGLLKVVGEYYGYRSLAFFDQINALLVLVAAMFTIASFRRHNEMTALLSAGIRKARLIRPIMIAAGVMVLFGIANRDLILPQIREQLTFNAQDLSEKRARAVVPTYDNETDILLSGDGVMKKSQRVVNPNFFLPRSLDHYGRQLIASEAIHQKGRADRPNGYLLIGLQQPKDLHKRPSLKLGDKPVVLTSYDTDWLEENQCFVVSEVHLELLTGGAMWRKYSSTPELIEAIGNPSVQQGANIEVELHSRFVQPFLDMTLLLLGLPLVLTRQSRNLFLSVGLCVLLVVVFMSVVMLFRHVGSTTSFSPTLAAWCPLMIFVPVAVAMSEPLRE